MDAIQWKLNVIFVVLLACVFCLWLLERKLARIAVTLAQLKKTTEAIGRRLHQPGPAFDDDGMG